MATRQTQLVPDVHKFPGHIACDGGSNSEIVVPMIREDKVVAVLDLDSYSFDRYGQPEQEALEKIAQLLIDGCDWEQL